MILDVGPDLLVMLTGVLEFAGAAGLLIPATARLAAGCLAALLLVMFPANVYAARRKLTIGGQKVPGLLPRTLLQIVFLGAGLAVAVA